MIPIRNNVPTRRFPIINTSIILVNTLIFLYQLTLPQEELQKMIFAYGVVPADLTMLLSGNMAIGGTAPSLTLLTATFLHGGWLHLLGNMVYLWVFGDNIEDFLGSSNYLLVYMLTGAIGHLAHTAFNPASPVPLIGASGAVAGVLGMYFVLYPRSRVLTLIPLGLFITFVEIPALIFLVLWFFLQVVNALGALAMGPEIMAVAWWAHIGGFISGIVIASISAKWGNPVS